MIELAIGDGRAPEQRVGFIELAETSLREAAYALGATRVSTIWRVVVPAALSGIGASVILALSRAVGETMIVAIAAGQEPRLTFDPRVPIATASKMPNEPSVRARSTGPPVHVMRAVLMRGYSGWRHARVRWPSRSPPAAPGAPPA